MQKYTYLWRVITVRSLLVDCKFSVGGCDRPLRGNYKSSYLNLSWMRAYRSKRAALNAVREITEVLSKNCYVVRWYLHTIMSTSSVAYRVCNSPVAPPPAIPMTSAATVPPLWVHYQFGCHATQSSWQLDLLLRTAGSVLRDSGTRHVVGLPGNCIQGLPCLVVNVACQIPEERGGLQ